MLSNVCFTYSEHIRTSRPILFTLDTVSIQNTKFISCPEWYFHTVEGSFSWVREPACTSELGNYAGSFLAVGRATHPGTGFENGASQRYFGPPSLMLGVGLTFSPHENYCFKILATERPRPKKAFCTMEEEICIYNAVELITYIHSVFLNKINGKLNIVHFPCKCLLHTTVTSS
jgi:hypothetical protein